MTALHLHRLTENTIREIRWKEITGETGVFTNLMESIVGSIVNRAIFKDLIMESIVSRAEVMGSIEHHHHSKLMFSLHVMELTHRF
jgi:hypothetical protein